MPAEVDIWVWTWGPPGSLADSAHFWDNPIIDTIRLILVIAGMCLVWAILRVLTEQKRRCDPMPRGQFWRFVSLLVFTASVAITECWVMGTSGTPRLVVNCLAITAGIIGVVGKRRKQLLEPHQKGTS